MSPARAAMGAALAAAGFVALALVIAAKWSPVLRLDHRIALHLNDYVAPHHTQAHFWRLVSDVLEPGIVRGVLVLVAVVLIVKKDMARALLCLGVALGSLLFVTVGKAIVGRPRPRVPHPVAHAPGASFPSGHAATSAAVALTVVVVVWPLASRAVRTAVVIAAGGLAVLVGFSRMILGVHYLTDVLGAWLGATALVLALLALIRFLGPRIDFTAWVRRRPRPAARSNAE